jgi:hypothetical protein
MPILAASRILRRPLADEAAHENASNKDTDNFLVTV